MAVGKDIFHPMLKLQTHSFIDLGPQCTQSVCGAHSLPMLLSLHYAESRLEPQNVAPHNAALHTVSPSQQPVEL